MTVPDNRSTWRKSSKSTQKDCVEVDMDNPAIPTVGVRDSKDKDGGQLRVSQPAWATFIDSLK